MSRLIDVKRKYQRASISLPLETLSPLHIGDGGVQQFSARNEDRSREAPLSDEARKASPPSSEYTTVSRDYQGHPYLPGSSLRGCLRQLASERCPAHVAAWFGPPTGDSTLHQGAVTVFDAMRTFSPARGSLANAVDGTGIVHAVSIDSISGAAMDNHLFSEEFVATGSRFLLRIELGPCNQADLNALLSVLLAVDTEGDARLGAGRSHGFGKLRACINELQVKEISADAIKLWLTRGGIPPAGRRVDVNVGKLLPRTVARALSFDLVMNGPFAVHDPGQVGGQVLPRGPLDDAAKQRYPDIEFSRDAGGKPIIPGRSLRGLLRHRAEKILATILHIDHQLDPTAASQRAHVFVNELFGDTRKRSAVRIEDATVIDGAPHMLTDRTFNAIDRFTGGVADGKLYTARLSAPTKLRFRLQVDRRIGKLPQWWLGLGLLVMRDAMEGDLALGWGKSKGLGAMHALWRGSALWSEALTDLRKSYGEAKPRECVQALHDHLAKQLKPAATS